MNRTLVLPDNISLPNLKVMYLHSIAFQNAKSIEKLFSCCPVLEELTLRNCELIQPRSITISFPSLRKLTICRSLEEFDRVHDPNGCSITVDVPALMYFNHTGILTNHLYLTNISSSSSIKASINIYTEKAYLCLVKLLQGLENMVSLTITEDTAKEMCGGLELGVGVGVGVGGRTMVTEAAARKEDDITRRRRALRRMDMELEKGNFKAALTLVKQLQDKPGGLRGFGSAKLVMEKMKLENELMVNIGEVDSVLRSIQVSRQLIWEEEGREELQRSIHILGESGAGKGSLEDGGCYNSLLKDREMCLQHEAGHFLLGYLLGVLPKRYKIPTMEDLLADNFAGGKIEFLTFEFLSQVYTSRPSNLNCTKTLQKNKENRQIVSSKTLNRFLCVILGGLVAEQLQFGYSELQHSDVDKLDRVLIWLGYNAIEARSKIKLAATNSIIILRKHQKVTQSLAETMDSGKSIGSCIDTIENTL